MEETLEFRNYKNVERLHRKYGIFSFSLPKGCSTNFKGNFLRQYWSVIITNRKNHSVVSPLVLCLCYSLLYSEELDPYLATSRCYIYDLETRNICCLTSSDRKICLHISDI